MKISCIVATAKNGVIGHHNQIPWYLPADLKYFKKITTGHHIIMGRNCYESIGRPLPNRTNIIVTRNPFYIVSNCLSVSSIEEALSLAYENGEEEVFIIGGGQIYEASQSLWDRIYLTEVDIECEGDVFFPKVDLDNWKLISTERHTADVKNEFDYCFNIYESKA